MKMGDEDFLDATHLEGGFLKLVLEKWNLYSAKKRLKV